MKTVAYIPIKLNNQRTPGKNIKPFSDGTPLIEFVQKALVPLRENEIVDDIYVYCSDSAIKQYLIDGVDYLERPNWLDRSETLGGEIYQSFFDRIYADVYVLAHATSPFVSTEHIKECVLKVQSGQYDSAFCAKKIQNFLWKSNKPLNFELSRPLRTQDMDPVFMELSTPYVYSRETWKKIKGRTGVRPYICECSEIEAIDIDYPEDFEMADVIYSNLLNDNGGGLDG